MPLKTRSELTSRMHEGLVIPPDPPVVVCPNARTVLAGKGPLRRARTRRALACCAPFRPWERACDGRLRRDHEAGRTFSRPDGREVINHPPLRIPPMGASGAASRWSASICGIERRKKIKDGRHVGLDFYDLLIEATKVQPTTSLGGSFPHW